MWNPRNLLGLTLNWVDINTSVQINNLTLWKFNLWAIWLSSLIADSSCTDLTSRSVELRRTGPLTQHQSLALTIPELISYPRKPQKPPRKWRPLEEGGGCFKRWCCDVCSMAGRRRSATLSGWTLTLNPLVVRNNLCMAGRVTLCTGSHRNSTIQHNRWLVSSGLGTADPPLLTNTSLIFLSVA